MKIFLSSAALLSCEALKVTSARGKIKKYLDLGVMKTKVASLSKKPFLLVSIAWPGSFRFTEHDLK